MNFQRLVYQWTLVELPALFAPFDLSMPLYMSWDTLGEGLKCLTVERLGVINVLLIQANVEFFHNLRTPFSDRIC